MANPVVDSSKTLCDSPAEVPCDTENINVSMKNALIENGDKNEFSLSIEPSNSLDETEHSFKLTEFPHSVKNDNKDVENTFVSDINENKLPVISELNSNLTNENLNIIETSSALNCDKNHEMFATPLTDKEALLNCGQSKIVAKNACNDVIPNLKLLSENILNSDTNAKDLGQENKKINLYNYNKVNGHEADENYQFTDAFNYLSNLVKAATNKKSAFLNANSTDVSTLVKKLCFPAISDTEPEISELCNNTTKTVRNLNVNSSSCVKDCSINLFKLNHNTIQMLLGGNSLPKEIYSVTYDSKLQNKRTKVDPVDSRSLQSVSCDVKISDDKSVLSAISSCKTSVQLSDSTNTKGFEPFKNIAESMRNHFSSKFNEDPITTTVLGFESEDSRCLIRNEPEDIFTNSGEFNMSDTLKSKFENESLCNREDKELNTLLKCVCDNINNDSNSSSEKSFELDFSYKFNFRVSHENDAMHSVSLIKNASSDVLCNKSKDSMHDFELSQFKKMLKRKSKKSNSMTSKTVDVQHSRGQKEGRKRKLNLDHITQVNESDQTNKLLTKSCIVLLPRINVCDCFSKQKKKKVNFSNSQSSKANMLNGAKSKLKTKEKKHFVPRSAERVPNSSEIIKNSLVEYKTLEENEKPTSELNYHSETRMIKKTNKTLNDMHSDGFETPNLSLNFKFSECITQEKNALLNFNLCNPSYSFQLEDSLDKDKNILKNDDVTMLPAVANKSLAKNPLKENASESESDSTILASFFKSPKQLPTSNLLLTSGTAKVDSDVCIKPCTVVLQKINFNTIKFGDDDGRTMPKKQKETNMLIFENVTLEDQVDVLENSEFIYQQHLNLLENVAIQNRKHDFMIKPCKVIIDKINIDLSVLLKATGTKSTNHFKPNYKSKVKSVKRELEDNCSSFKTERPCKSSKILENCNLDNKSEMENVSNDTILESTLPSYSKHSNFEVVNFSSESVKRKSENKNGVRNRRRPCKISKILENRNLDSKSETGNVSHNTVLESTLTSYTNHSNFKVVDFSSESVKKKSEGKNGICKRERHCKSSISKSPENYNLDNESERKIFSNSAGLKPTFQSCSEHCNFKCMSFFPMSVQREYENQTRTPKRMRSCRTESFKFSDNCDMEAKNTSGDTGLNFITDIKLQNNSECNFEVENFPLMSAETELADKNEISVREKPSKMKCSKLSSDFDSDNELETKNTSSLADLELEYVNNAVTQDCSKVMNNSFENSLLLKKDNLTEKFVRSDSELDKCQEVKEVLIKNDEANISSLCHKGNSVNHLSLKPCFVRLKRLDLSSLGLIEYFGNIKLKNHLAENKFGENLLFANKVCVHTGSTNPNAVTELVSKELQKNQKKIANTNGTFPVDDKIFSFSQHVSQNSTVSIRSDSSNCCVEWKEENSEQWTISFKKQNFVNKKGEKMSKFFCLQCDRNLKSAEDLFYHLCSGKKKEGFLCMFCEKIFHSCCSLTSHKISHVINFA